MLIEVVVVVVVVILLLLLLLFKCVCGLNSSLVGLLFESKEGEEGEEEDSELFLLMLMLFKKAAFAFDLLAESCSDVDEV